MLIGTVAAVNHGNTTAFGKLGYRALGGVAHCNNVRVATQYARRIEKRLPLGNCRTFKAGRLSNLTPQQIKGTAKTNARACGGFKKHGT